MPKDLGPMDVYRLLPGDNCGECGTKTCMGFATELIERRADVVDCPPMTEPKNESQKEELVELLTPLVRPVTIGDGEDSCVIGGEDVMYRHEKTWFNPVAMIIDVHDEMDDDELVDKVEWISSYSRIKIGERLSFDGVAVRSKSGDPEAFKHAVELASENTDYPIVLCSYDSDVLESGLEVVGDSNPLLYAANMDNWEDIADLAMEHDCPMTVSSRDIDGLIEISTRAKAKGVEEDKIVLDPGTDPQDLRSTTNKIVKLRRAAIEDEFRPLRHPILGIPATAWMQEDDENEAAFMEGTISCVLTDNAVDALIFHSDEIWSLMPNMVLGQDLYQDPRNPASVEPELHEVGNPDEDSPILITTNFALTYYTVEGDCEGIDCYIYPVDTDGTSVTSAVAGDMMTADKVVDAIEEEGFEDKVSHRSMILPGDAAVLSGQIEVDSGWNVLVGPGDSSGIKDFLADNWPPEEED